MVASTKQVTPTQRVFMSVKNNKPMQASEPNVVKKRRKAFLRPP